MTEFVSIKADNGRVVSVSKDFADTLKDVEILDEPATNLRGRPLGERRAGGRRAKPKTTVAKAAAKKTASTATPPSEPGDPTSGVAADQEEIA